MKHRTLRIVLIGLFPGTVAVRARAPDLDQLKAKLQQLE